MSSGLTSTKHFGFSAAWLRDGLQAVQRGDVRSFSGNPALAHELAALDLPLVREEGTAQRLDLGGGTGE